MKILLTGAAGFIGSHLAEKLLSEGNEVYGVDNFDMFYPRSVKEKNVELLKKYSGFNFFEADITNKGFYAEIDNDKYDLIYHLAAKAGVRPSIKAPDKYISTNIEGTLNVLEYMRTGVCSKMVFGSSSSVYGNCKVIPFKEDLLTDEPISPYAFTKKSCELLNFNYHHLYNFDIVNLRFFTVFGPRQRPDLAIHKFLKLIDNGEPIEIYGDGSTARDYTFVEDIVDGVTKAGKYLLGNSGVYDTFNIGNNSPVKLLDMVNLLKKILNKDFSVVYKEMQDGDVEITYANIEKAKSILGYEPKTSFEEGLRKFIAWHNSEK